MKRNPQVPQERIGWLASRWQGRVSPSVLLWRDMIVVGTLLNLTTGIIALMLMANGAAPLLAVTVHFLLLPYNLFLVLCFWRSKPRGPLLSAVALLWFGIVTLL